MNPPPRVPSASIGGRQARATVKSRGKSFLLLVWLFFGNTLTDWWV